jgi:hypothetical protein
LWRKKFQRREAEYAEFSKDGHGKIEKIRLKEEKDGI